MSTEPTPLRVFFGWSGSGKSALIEALAKHAGDVTIVHDDGRSDLISSLEDVVEAAPESRIFIEADPVLEPIAIAELFYLEGENGEPPEDRFEISTVATVLDCRTVLETIRRPRALIELDLDFDDVDDRTNADVIIEQIEFSDVVVLNQTSDIAPETLAKTRSLVEWLNPRAQLIEVPQDGFNREFVEEFWQACRRTVFDFDDAAEGAGWIQLLANSHPKLDRGVGLSSIGIRGRRPLHPERFKTFLDSLGGHDIVRVKGWIWIATRNGETGIWSVAGRSSILAAAGAWMAATPMREWPEDPLEREDIMADWVPPYGDRRQEVAIMGFDLNEFELRRAFKACMLNDEEFALGPEGWAKWPDPLPDWSVDGGDDFDGLLQ